MKNKIMCIGVVSLLLFITLPMEKVFAEGPFDDKILVNATSDSLTLCHVVVTGEGRCLTFKGTFFLGFGKCWVMSVNLEEDEHIELTSLLDSSNTVVLEGSQQIFIIGFLGFRMVYGIQMPKNIMINGLAFLVYWS